MSENTKEGIERLAARSSIEDLIRALADEGNINHLSLSVGPDGRSFVAIFRDTIGLGPYRYMTGNDPVDVMKRALASVVIVQKDETAELRKRQRAAGIVIPKGKPSIESRKAPPDRIAATEAKPVRGRAYEDDLI